MLKSILLTTSVAAIVLLFSFSSCKKDKLLTDSIVHLTFSDDTLRFDTVFVTAGSATQIFTVHNNESQPIRISSIRLGHGDASYYRLNVNGVPGKSFSDVEIGANDSIWIFAEVTIPDPNNPNTPFVVTDSIVFQTNGNQQDVKLIAWGQRAHFHYYPPNSPPLFFLNCNDIWTNDLPHVVYGYALIDSACTLTMEQGVRVHFHNSSGLIALSGGKIVVNGTRDSVVTFQGDRLGEDFKDVPGQWDRIWLSNISRSNLLYGLNVSGAGPKGNHIT